MLKSTHADVLNKPYAQIKDLKLYCPDKLDDIKANHQQSWQRFKAFIFAIYANLPPIFAKPHVESWCNGWEIRRHLFAYYKYEQYLAHAPIISVILNKYRLVISLDWHSYKAKYSSSSLSDFNEWLTMIDTKAFDGYYYWHKDTKINTPQPDDIMPISRLDDDMPHLDKDDYYRLGLMMTKDGLDDFGDDELVAWATHHIKTLAGAYEWCHGRGVFGLI